jgi:hypothetical protein
MGQVEGGEVSLAGESSSTEAKVSVLIPSSEHATNIHHPVPWRIMLRRTSTLAEMREKSHDVVVT